MYEEAERKRRVKQASKALKPMVKAMEDERQPNKLAWQQKPKKSALLLQLLRVMRLSVVMTTLTNYVVGAQRCKMTCASLATRRRAV